MLIITVGGVYATWTYISNADVPDESINMAMNLTGVSYSEGYGTYQIDKSTLQLLIDPKPGTTHITSLKAEGEIKVTFRPSTHAPSDIEKNGVVSTYTISLSNSDWKFNDGNGEKVIATLEHTDPHDIVWTPNGDGTFSFTLSAEDLASHISLTEFDLDTKTLNDAYSATLASGTIIFAVSDGVTSSNP